MAIVARLFLLGALALAAGCVRGPVYIQPDVPGEMPRINGM